jgi:hypothetical protein
MGGYNNEHAMLMWQYIHEVSECKASNMGQERLKGNTERSYVIGGSHIIFLENTMHSYADWNSISYRLF